MGCNHEHRAVPVNAPLRRIYSAPAEVEHRGRQAIERIDKIVGVVFGYCFLTVTELNRDDRDTRCTCGTNIRNRVSDHHRVAALAASGCDRLVQHRGIRLHNAERVLSAYGGEALSKAERPKKE